MDSVSNSVHNLILRAYSFFLMGITLQEDQCYVNELSLLMSLSFQDSNGISLYPMWTVTFCLSKKEGCLFRGSLPLVSVSLMLYLSHYNGYEAVHVLYGSLALQGTLCKDS